MTLGMDNLRTDFLLVVVVVGTFGMCAAGRGLASFDGPKTPRLYVFGDSLVDNGNLFQATNGTVPNPQSYEQGRFSNGPIWVEKIAFYLRLTIEDLAFGGSTACPAPSQFPQVPNLPQLPNQVELLDTRLANQRRQIEEKDLVIIASGSNDIIQSLPALLRNPNVTNPAFVASFIDTLSTSVAKCNQQSIEALINLGARRFLIANTPIGSPTPFALTLPLPAQQLLRQIALAANAKLELFAEQIRAEYQNTKVAIFDAASFLDGAINNPGDFGLTVVDQMCLTFPPEVTQFFILSAAQSRCTSPSQYLFWDNLHPTAAGQWKIALAAMKVIKDEQLLKISCVTWRDKPVYCCRRP